MNPSRRAQFFDEQFQRQAIAGELALYPVVGMARSNTGLPSVTVPV